MTAVSVLTTCYNREAYIAETIESVLAQTFQDFEYIIVDDGSKDRSFAIAQSYAAKDSRVKVFRNETNLGDYPNRNKAASYASGEYLKYIDSDDILYPHAIQVMMTCMQRFPNAALGLSSRQISSAPYPICLPPEQSVQFHFEQSDVFGRAPGSAIIRRDRFQQVGGFSGTRFVGDFEMWIRLAVRFPIVVFPADLTWARTHPQQEAAIEDWRTRYRRELAALNKILDESTTPQRDLISQFMQMFEKQHRKQNLRGLVLKCVRWPAYVRRSIWGRP